MTFRYLFPSLIVYAIGASPAAEPVLPDNQAVTNIPLTSAADSLAKMHLPPGFKATVVAAEPDIRNPIAMTWDNKGRLWVAENYTYSDSNERFNMTLHDRILIFEDKDNDGRYDERKVFSDDVQMLTSIERGQGGVYAMCPPHLLWIPDANNDDKPDGPPVVVLDGFSTQAVSRHTLANGLKWGPDGWLYGRVGISSTSFVGTPGTPEDKRQPTAGGIWRYHPIKKVYEPYCHGTTNPWGMDWDENGEPFFINTVIGHFWHAIPGAHFKRMHGEDPYPYIYGQIEQHADHYHWDTGKKWMETRDGAGVTDTLGGGHAHVGMMIYQGSNWPKEYRGKVYTLNLHGRRTNIERIEPHGSGYVAKHEPDILKTDDQWFRGIEIGYGPDGGVYMLDWSDIGECHENDGVHRNSGRIYKITYGDAVKPKEADVSKLSEADLVKLHTSDNEWLVRAARKELRERQLAGTDMSAAFASLTAQAQQDQEKGAGYKSLLTLMSLSEDLKAGQDTELASALVKALEDNKGSEHFRKLAIHYLLLDYRDETGAWAFHPAFSVPGQGDATLSRVTDLVRNETSPSLRLAYASCLSRMSPAQAAKVAAPLLGHAEDAGDHNLPLMYWYGIKDLPAADLAKLAEGCRIPLVTEFITRRITEEMERDVAPLNSVLTLATTSGKGTSADVLKGMTAAFNGWRKAKKPEAWDAFAAALAKDESVATMLRDINVLFGDGRALDEVRKTALNDQVEPGPRRAALQTLIEAKSPDSRAICDKLLYDRALALSAVQGLATFDDPAIADKIISRYKTFYPHERGAVVQALSSRPSFARVLLKHLNDKEIPRTDVTPLHARQIRSFNDEALTKELASAWGELRESSEDKKVLITTLKAKLTPDVLSKADHGQGRLIYSQLCAMCHKLYGEGAAIGPDLTGSGRRDLSYLLENIADPSGMVAADYKMTVLTLKDGRILNGVIHGQNERTLTVTMVGQETTVDKGDIVKQEQLPVSLMPEGLLMALQGDQVRDLIGYLMGSGQVPLPK